MSQPRIVSTLLERRGLGRHLAALGTAVFPPAFGMCLYGVGPAARRASSDRP